MRRQRLFDVLNSTRAFSKEPLLSFECPLGSVRDQEPDGLCQVTKMLILGACHAREQAAAQYIMSTKAFSSIQQFVKMVGVCNMITVMLCDKLTIEYAAFDIDKVVFTHTH